jgi:hypothetical protein
VSGTDPVKGRAFTALRDGSRSSDPAAPRKGPSLRTFRGRAVARQLPCKGDWRELPGQLPCYDSGSSAGLTYRVSVGPYPLRCTTTAVSVVRAQCSTPPVPSTRFPQEVASIPCRQSACRTQTVRCRIPPWSCDRHGDSVPGSSCVQDEQRDE